MSTCAWITHAACHGHDMGEGHPECPGRLDAICDHLLSTGIMQLLVPYDAPRATNEQLARAHTALHVLEIESLAPKDGLVHLDPDTAMGPGSLEAALRAAGAAVLATDLVLRGEVTRAFCAVRPPGHHAKRDAAMGFCIFNNVAVGIRHALDVHGLARV
ncbi:MAG: histone deacetylase family protein, partial [Usitatibacter sp.]